MLATYSHLLCTNIQISVTNINNYFTTDCTINGDRASESTS